MRRIFVCIFIAMTMLGADLTPALAQRSLMGTLYSSGVKAYEKGNYRDALRIFRQCEEMAKTTRHSQGEKAYLLYSVAETLRCAGALKEAEHY